MKSTTHTFYQRKVVMRYKFGPGTSHKVGNPAIPPGDVPVEFAEAPREIEGGACLVTLKIAPHDGSLKSPVRAFAVYSDAAPAETDDASAYLLNNPIQSVSPVPADTAAGVEVSIRVDAVPPDADYHVQTILEYAD